MTAKLIPLLLLLLTLMPARAEEHRAELLVRVLQPLLAPFVRQTPSPNRALETELSLIAMTGAPQELIGTKIRLAVQYPNKILLQGPLFGQELTLCRNEKDLWIAPKSKADALFNQLGGDPGDQKTKFRLGNLEIPFSQAQLIFLPALFQVKEYAPEQVGGVSCRILELSLLPELARPLGVENWQARLWIGPDYQLAKLEVLKPQWHILVAVDKLAYSPTLSASTWAPSPELAADAMHLKGERVKLLIDAISQNLGQ